MRWSGVEEGWQSFEEFFHHLQQREIAVNYATLVGHGNLRSSCLGYAKGNKAYYHSVKLSIR